MKQAFSDTATAAPADAQFFKAALKGDLPEIARLIAAGANIEARNAVGHTPLMIAAARGHLAAAQALLDAGADVNAVTKGGNTAVGVTASLPDAALTELLLARGADPLLGQADVQKNLLRAAVSRGQEQLFDRLIAAGTDFRYADAGGRTLLMLSCEAGQPGMLKRLVALGLDPLVKDRASRTSATRAAEAGSEPCLRILLDAGATLEEDNYGSGLLTLAARKGAPDAVALLLERGADPNLNHDRDNAPLRAAIRSKDLRCVELLLQHGADPLSKAREKSQELTDEEVATAQGGEIGKLVSAAARKFHLPLAAKEGDLALMRTLLEEGIPTETRDYGGCTALLNAVEQCKPDAVRLLLEYKADPNAAAGHGRTPLIDAVKSFDWKTPERDPELVELLLQAGADPNTLDARKKLTALATAVAKSEIAMISSLLAHKADPNLACGDKGRTPLFTAVEMKSPELVKLLIDGGASVNVKDAAGTPLKSLADECGNREIRDLVLDQYRQEMEDIAESSTQLNDQVTPLKALKYKQSARKPVIPRH